MESERRGVKPGLYWRFLGSEIHDLTYDLATPPWHPCAGQTVRGQGGRKVLRWWRPRVVVVTLFVAVMEEGGGQLWGFLYREQAEPTAREKECGREVKGESRRASALAGVTKSLRLLLSILSGFPGLPREPPLL